MHQASMLMMAELLQAPVMLRGQGRSARLRQVQQLSGVAQQLASGPELRFDMTTGWDLAS
jgi:hypothetical protein